MSLQIWPPGAGYGRAAVLVNTYVAVVVEFEGNALTRIKDCPITLPAPGGPSGPQAVTHPPFVQTKPGFPVVASGGAIVSTNSGPNGMAEFDGGLLIVTVNVTGPPPDHVHNGDATLLTIGPKHFGSGRVTVA
jgi:hypothetical protein